MREIAELKLPDLNTTRPRVGDALRRGHRALDGARSRLSHGRGRARNIARRLTRRSNREKKYSVDEACAILPKIKISPKCDETVDVAIRLGVNPKYADQMVRGSVNLPHGTGKTKRVLVIAKGDKAKEALEAGADFVGAEDFVEKIPKENWFEFDSPSRRRT